MMRRRASLPPYLLWICISLPACNGCSCGFGGPSSSSCSSSSSSSGGGGCGGGFGSGGFVDGGRQDGLPGTWVDSGQPNTMPGGVVLTKLAGAPGGIAMLDGTLYVIDGDRVRRAYVEAPPTTPDGGIGDASSDADQLDASPVDASPDASPDGGTSDVLAVGIGDVDGLTSFGEHLYWARRAKGTTPGAIVRMRVRPFVDVPEDIAPSNNALEGIVADETGVRWLEDMEGLYRFDGSTTSLVAGAPVATSARFSQLARSKKTTWFIAQDQVIALADDGTWSTQTLSGVLAIAAEGPMVYPARSGSQGVDVGYLNSNVFSLYTTYGDVRAMTVSGGAIFVSDEVRSIVAKADQKGTTTLAWPAQPPHDMVASSSWVYFTTVGSPSDVRRVSR